MSNIFSGSEIVEMGIQIEKNGKDFYEALNEKSNNKRAKEVFRYLAGEEEKHISTFKKILSSVEAYEPAESYPGEYFKYMNSLASEYVFTQKDKGRKIAQDTKSDKEAFELGIGFEKDSIVFYEGIKRAVPKDSHRLIDALIEQEQDHLRQLQDLKRSSS